MQILSIQKFLSIFFGCLLLVSCGGGGGSTETEVGSEPGPTVIDLGNIAFWSFDNMIGNSAPNTKFDGLPIDFQGVSIVAGKFGNAVSFDETRAISYGEISGNTNGGNMLSSFIELDFPSGISFAAWVNPRKIDPGSTYQIMGDGLFGLKSFSIRLENGRVQAIADSSNLIIASTSTISTGTWTHVAISYFGGTAKVYLNGVLDSTQSVLLSIPTARNRLYVGGRQVVANADYIFPGSIDEIYLSSSELTPAGLANLLAGVRP